MEVVQKTHTERERYRERRGTSVSYITIKDNYMWRHVERNSHQQRSRRSVDNKQEGVQGVVVVEKELEQRRKSSVSRFTQGLLFDDQEEEHDDGANSINCSWD